MSLASAVNVSVAVLAFVAGLAVELAWNFHAIETDTRYWLQPRIITLVCACAVVQMAIHWHTGGYRRDDERDRTKGFPVIMPHDKDHP